MKKIDFQTIRPYFYVKKSENILYLRLSTPSERNTISTKITVNNPKEWDLVAQKFTKRRDGFTLANRSISLALRIPLFFDHIGHDEDLKSICKILKYYFTEPESYYFTSALDPYSYSRYQHNFYDVNKDTPAIFADKIDEYLSDQIGNLVSYKILFRQRSNAVLYNSGTVVICLKVGDKKKQLNLLDDIRPIDWNSKNCRVNFSDPSFHKYNKLLNSIQSQIDDTVKNAIDSKHLEMLTLELFYDIVKQNLAYDTGEFDSEGEYLHKT